MGFSLYISHCLPTDRRIRTGRMSRNLHGAGFVAGLFRMGIECRMSKLIHGWIMHRGKYMAARNRRCDDCPKPNVSSARQNIHLVAVRNTTRLGIQGADFDVRIVRVELSQDR